VVVKRLSRILGGSENPEGVDGQVFKDIQAAIVKDRYAYFKDFFAPAPPRYGTSRRHARVSFGPSSFASRGPSSYP
jgi:hypothetical protein